MEAKILVVDGDKQVREYLSNMLGSVGGFSVVVAETAEGALQKIRSETFDLVLVDLKLPDRDGLQLITEIVNFKPEALTVLITGHGSIDSAVEAMKRGPSDYLTKPFDLDDTLARLRRVLQEKKRFIPLTTMTMSSIRKEEIGYATSIFNLLRNLGGSFGMAFVTTMLARRGQLHQVHLGEHFTPFDRNFQLALPQISQTLRTKVLFLLFLIREASVSSTARL